MSRLTRRTLLAGGAALTALGACGNPIGGAGPARIDARVDETLNFMFATYPGTRDLDAKAVGKLVIPVVTEAGLGFGASYGRGALRVGNSTVDYYSATAVSGGLQIGAQQFSHVLFFMTQQALMEFRTSNGWAVGADAEYVLNNEAENIRAETTTSLAPVIAVIFAQAGLRVGATVEGTKYTRIIP